MNSYEKKIRILLIIRAVLWLGAISATVYWMRWSFYLYKDYSYDTTTYALLLRPKFALGLGISVVCVVISTILGKISDRLRQEERNSWQTRNTH